MDALILLSIGSVHPVQIDCERRDSGGGFEEQSYGAQVWGQSGTGCGGIHIAPTGPVETAALPWGVWHRWGIYSANPWLAIYRWFGAYLWSLVTVCIVGWWWWWRLNGCFWCDMYTSIFISATLNMPSPLLFRLVSSGNDPVLSSFSLELMWLPQQRISPDPMHHRHCGRWLPGCIGSTSAGTPSVVTSLLWLIRISGGLQW